MKYLMTPKTRAISEAFNTIEAFVGAISFYVIKEWNRFEL